MAKLNNLESKIPTGSRRGPLCALILGWLVAVGSPSGGVRTMLAKQQSTGADPQQLAMSAGAPAGWQRATLDRYCVTCHNEKSRTGGLALDNLDLSAVSKRADLWEKVARKLEAGLMPPAGRPRPDQTSYDRLISWIETELDRVAAAQPDPGRTPAFHRLNRAEYRNAIRDLLAVDLDVTQVLPADDAVYGFDNIAGVLKINQSLMERYLAAALGVSRAAVGRPLPAPRAAEFRISPDLPQYDRMEGLPFGTRGGTLIHHAFPQDGEYTIKVELMCGPISGGECDGGAGFADSHQLEVTLDRERVRLFTLESRPHRNVERLAGWSPAHRKNESIKKDTDLQVRIPVRAGTHDVGVAFLKLPSIEEVEGPRQRFLKPAYISSQIQKDWVYLAIYQPAIASVTINGPFNATGAGDTTSRRRLFVCQPTQPLAEALCAKTVLSNLARRAYRRPVSDADLQPLLRLYNDSRVDGGFEAGIEMALRFLLVSPEFLFRIERDPPNIALDSNYPISDLELASRLSFFLWSSIPDDQLLDVASRGNLKDPAVLEHQVRRMLSDSRSEALTSNFVGQWLELRNLEAVRPSAAVFPDFDESLRQSFRRETELLFESIVQEDRSVLDLLTANYTFVNERLARHYQIPNVQGPDFRRVTVNDDLRRGLLGHGSILTITSSPIRTSPVKRGKFILDNFLGTPPPPPPANVPAFKESQEKGKVLTVRERMAEHRANPVCANCHRMIDPPGFALENFDAVGRIRSLEEGLPIDASGTLPDGSKFDGLAGFRAALVSHPNRFVTTLTEKLLTYAVGRRIEYYDMPAERKIVREAAQNDYRFSSLIFGVVRSLPFQMRRAVSPPSTSLVSARH